MIRRRSDNQTETVTPPKRQRITLNRKNPHKPIDTNRLLGATTRHNIQQPARKPISKPQHLSSQQLTTTHEPRPQPQTAECSNYGHQGLSDKLILHHNPDAPGSMDSITLYMIESSAKVVRLERKTYLVCTISIISNYITED